MTDCALVGLPAVNGAQVPVEERLRAVPKGLRMLLETETWSSSTPVGHLCHEAADLIEQLRRNCPAEPIQLHGEPEMRCEALMQALMDVLDKRGKGLPMSLVIDALRLLEFEVIKREV